jgi:hypothetical protein
MELPHIQKAMKLQTKDDIKAIKDVYGTLHALSSYGLDLHKDHVMGDIDVSKSLNVEECKNYIAKLGVGERMAKVERFFLGRITVMNDIGSLPLLLLKS